MIYIITGGPATGKGTRANILSKKVNVPHISTGELLRKEASENIEIANKLAKGELITDEIITKILNNRIIEKDCDNGFILDGYPRTYPQVVMLDEMLKKLNRSIYRVVELVIPDELAFKRILERKTCSKCKKSYGIDFPPIVENICDKCGGKLIIRTDDTEETLRKRLETYKENSKAILEHYKKIGILRTIDASAHPEEIVEVVE